MRPSGFAEVGFAVVAGAVVGRLMAMVTGMWDSLPGDDFEDADADEEGEGEREENSPGVEGEAARGCGHGCSLGEALDGWRFFGLA